VSLEIVSNSTKSISKVCPLIQKYEQTIGLQSSPTESQMAFARPLLVPAGITPIGILKLSASGLCNIAFTTSCTIPSPETQSIPSH